MHFDHFFADFGVLPSAYFAKKAITNPIELFWSDDLVSLMRLCGMREEMIGDRASDFDKFQAICHTLELLDGHPTRARIVSILEKHFNLNELPTQETATEVWRTLCDRLLEDPIDPKTLVGGEWLCDAMDVPNNLPQGIAPVLNANLLLAADAKSTAAWSAQIAATVANFTQKGSQKVLLSLEKNFDFVLPSIYQVDRALSLARKDKQTENLLLSQLVRELCTACKQNNLLLVLVCHQNADGVVQLLKYCEDTVGLPRLCWSMHRATDAQALLEFTAQPHQNEIFAALLYQNILTQAELSAAIESWQVRYPIGRLRFITARDLRQKTVSQAHIVDMIKKMKTKI
ncbi:MAG: glucuronate isomerase [Clostridia bacterium]|nr:glucuronate isomerase [Clostridia bacterium]